LGKDFFLTIFISGSNGELGGFMRFLSWLFCLFGLIAAAYASESKVEGQVGMVKAVDEIAIQHTIDAELAKYIAAFKNQDTLGMSRLYAEDVTILEPKSAPKQGREAIQKMWDGNKNDREWKNVVLQRYQLHINGDMAYELGKAIFTYQKAGAAPYDDVSEYLTVWKKQANGEWKVQAESWIY